MAISVAICEILSVKEWCDLENRVRVHSRSLEMAPFDRSHTSSVPIRLPQKLRRYLVSFARYSDLLVENRESRITFVSSFGVGGGLHSLSQTEHL